MMSFHLGQKLKVQDKTYDIVFLGENSMRIRCLDSDKVKTISYTKIESILEGTNSKPHKCVSRGVNASH